MEGGKPSVYSLQSSELSPIQENSFVQILKSTIVQWGNGDLAVTINLANAFCRLARWAVLPTLAGLRQNMYMQWICIVTALSVVRRILSKALDEHNYQIIVRDDKIFV